MAVNRASIPRMVSVLTLTCAIMGGALSMVYKGTKAEIDRQERIYKLKSIKAVLPEYDNNPDEETISVNHPERGDVEFYPARKDGELVGLAFEWSSPEGYGGEIKVLIGINPQGILTGIEILPGHAETPGLGAKIQGSQWREQFNARNIDNTKWGVDKDGGDISSITGATISPRAVTNAVKQGLEFFITNRDSIITQGVVE